MKMSSTVDRLVKAWRDEDDIELAYQISLVYASADMRKISATLKEFRERIEGGYKEK